MQSTETIQLEVKNAVPSGGEQETALCIDLWRQIDGFFKDRPFKVEDPYRGKLGEYDISLDASDMVRALQQAKDSSGSFNHYRRKHAEDSSVSLSATLSLKVAARNDLTAPYSIYHTASVFIQQLMLGMNIALPGSCQLLATRFLGEQAHRFEAQDFDSKAFYDANQSAVDHGWPRIGQLNFEKVWDWFEMLGTSHRNTAISTANKVLVDMLKIAQQRYRYGARTAMLVANQLEMLIGARNDEDMQHLRERVSLVLGRPPESADCFKELYRLRHALFLGEHPVRRPTLGYHDADEEIKQQLSQHNSGVEKAIAVVLALVQDLIETQSREYAFTEQMSRR
ncbi:hypothetical protein EUZ85_01405 [Hahella sp. KA22]|uniref:hypothetical protein n=1 Tax=Hahella sp. KA22 TaxID=1628392 RepID=UPI000FDD2EF8|nr:hypothetical protein [Hahella sp. KA22]AZZ95151.1 hypothetical protein ENC22_29695 [Hahella sp. KA22]QAY52796.1 hypothetical protein EUZ85_01405 [Hahella sp. KA22]